MSMVRLFAFCKLRRVAVPSRCCVCLVFGGDHGISRPGFRKISITECHGMLMRIIMGVTRVVIPAGTSHIVIIVIIGISRADRAGSGVLRKCRPGALPIPMPACRLARASGVLRHQAALVLRRCRSGATLPRRQSHRASQPVVRTLHEHGFAAFRFSRHRLGHGCLLRPLRPARFRTSGR